MSLGRRPVMLLVPLVWLAVVVVVAGVTWQVIDAAGRQVLTSGAPPPLSPSGTTQRADGATNDNEPGKHHRGGGRPSQSANPTGSPEPPAPSNQGTVQAGPTPDTEPTPRPGPPAGQPDQQTDEQPSQAPDQQPSQQPSDEPPSQTQVRSWQGAAGTVTASCTGARISLQSVTPNDGWQVEVGDRGPQHIAVHFRSRGEEERETEVKAACSGGVPRFQVAADD